MAGYKAHLAAGRGVGFAGGLWLIFSASLSLIYLPIIFIATIVGSFLPDLDSDSGRPIQILFLTIGIIASFLGCYYLVIIIEPGMLYVVLATSSIFVIVNFVLKRLFMRYTVHRGIFHSLVAVVILTLSVNSLLLSLDLNLFDSIIISSALGTGYLSHLVLDEMYSLVNLSGIPFIPKKSLGTALKISALSLRMNTVIIMMLIILIYANVKLIIH